MVRRATWIVLGIFAAVLAFTIWWASRPSQGIEGQATPAAGPLWELDTAQVRSIRLENLTDGEAMEVMRDPLDVWRVVEPVTGRADAARVEQALSSLASPQPQTILSSVQDLEPYNLATPERRVTITMKDGTDYRFDVGRATPTGSGIYIRVEDAEDVVVLSQYVLEDVLGLLDEVPLVPTATPSPTSEQEIGLGEPSTQTPSAAETPTS
jgi:hypothetical protein